MPKNQASSISNQQTAQAAQLCYHCGEETGRSSLYFDEKSFCCQGCKTVYQLLNQNGLCAYYEQGVAPGFSQKVPIRDNKFAFLEEKSIAQQLIQFEDEEKTQVVFYLPQIHCSSCLWLLENLQNMNPAIISGRVDFNKKEITILYRQNNITLRQLAELLASIGYEPHLSLRNLDKKPSGFYNRQRIYRLGVAGFCFSNIMLLSFPEYFGLQNVKEAFDINFIFGYLTLALSIPVFFYSAQEFFKASWSGIKQRHLNIDLPIALAIIITFIRSVYEIVSGTGAGYLDSMSGIVFFMLTGRILQDRTNQSLSFDRDYTSYFPLAVSRINDGIQQMVTLPELKSGDQVIIHSGEIIPADGILSKGQGAIDYSFVTGESMAVPRQIGEMVYAGGRQTQGNIEILLVKEVSQSYLTSLWNKDSMRGEDNNQDSFIHKLSRYFTAVLFLITAITAAYWYFNDPSKIWPSVTAALIVACPCALLLSNTFTNGHIIRLLDKAGFYVRNSAVVERMCRLTHLVFDKTGTLTSNNQYAIGLHGHTLQPNQLNWLATLAQQSQHPLSKTIAAWLNLPNLKVTNFKETIGKGCEAWIEERHIVLGSPEFVLGKPIEGPGGAVVAFRIDQEATGFFLIKNQYRPGIKSMFRKLSRRYGLSVISGDNDTELETLQKLAGPKSELLFNQSPTDKLEYTQLLGQKGKQVMMVGDGLNDAGALKQSLAGIAVTDDIHNFSPACSAIMEAKNLQNLPLYLQLARRGKRIVIASFIISILYNFVGLSFAIQGLLSPMIAAILMPASSISIVFFTWLSVNMAGHSLLKAVESPI